MYTYSKSGIEKLTANRVDGPARFLRRGVPHTPPDPENTAQAVGDLFFKVWQS
jgi:hypothetical protein